MNERSSDDSGPWDRTWMGLHHCSECNGLHTDYRCGVCGHEIDLTPMAFERNGAKHLIPVATAGALPRSSFALLNQMQVEWERPSASLPENRTRYGSERLVIVILFWTLFETLMDRFYLAAFADLPGELGGELLRRFPNIGGRLDRLYKLRWDTTFWDNLADNGYPEAAKHLRAVQTARNNFVHGDPEAIDDALVQATVDQLRGVQWGWVTVFNQRCTGMNKKVQLWEKDIDTRK